MELNTFGAVMGFAVDYDQRASEWYSNAAALAQGAQLKAKLQELGEVRAKRKKLMERVRRENVTEMILEPISGLDSAAFEVSTALPTKDAEILSAAKVREASAERFYAAASAKLSIPEVSRIFKKIARDIAEYRVGLE
jgi:rubrerythrin